MDKTAARPKGRVTATVDRLLEFSRGRPAIYTGYGLGAVLVLVGLYFSRRYSYILYHSLVEIFTIVVAAGVFMIAWNSRRVLDNNYLLFIGIAYLFIAGIDIAHTLAYKGVGVFPNHGTDLPTQLWVSARYLQAITLVIAPFFLGRRMKTGLVFIGYAAAAAFVFLAIFQWHICPACFVEGAGLTRFKEISEYVISLLLLLSIYLLYRKRDAFDRGVFLMLVSSIALTIASELSFTLYADPFGFANFAGHIFRLAAFYLIYKAIIQTGLTKPVNLLFRNLKRSEEELREANIELEGYAYTVSHDLRGPLSAIAMADSMLKEEAAEPSVKEAAPEIEHFAGIIERNVEKSHALINDILALAQAGRKPTESEEVDISELVAGVLVERSAEIQEKGISTKVDEVLGTVAANHTQMYQVFSNLVGNSIKYNDAAHPVLEVRHLGDEADGGHRFLVRDNGPGIPPEVIDNIFVPFVKGDRGGTGIGLSTVDRIVKAYGGLIRAYNDNGACFEFLVKDVQPQ